MDVSRKKDQLDIETGKRLATARRAKGYTQKQMAEIFGITQQGYRYFEHGRQIKSLMLVKLCSILECSPSWLLGVKEEGQHLEPEDPIMARLNAACDKLNDKGKKKVADYAEDLAGNAELTIRVNGGRPMQNDKVSGVA